MRKNRLGNSDLEVSEIGFGTMSLPENEDQAVKMIHQAIDGGINFFDTADLYDFGRIENLLGNALKGRRDEIIIATKGGNHWEDGKAGWYWDPSKQYIKQAVQSSLKRLRTDYIDLYQMHGGTIDDDLSETIETLEELKQVGLIRHYGISSIRPNVIRPFAEGSSMASVMMQYSMLDRRPEEAMLDLLEDNQISAIARGPVAKGLLSDRWTEKLSDDGYLDYTKDELEAIVPKLQDIADGRLSLSEMALKYVLSCDAVSVAVPGASSPEQLVKNIQAAGAPDLTTDEIEAIRRVSRPVIYDKHR